MSDRERKRAERRKRKQRSVEQRLSSNGAGSGEESPLDLVSAVEETGPSRSELKNQTAREALEPLAVGERPTVVTIGAVVSLLIAVSILVGYFAGIEVDLGRSEGAREPTAFESLPPALLFLVMAIGMWKARYWAVLGFQAIMAIIMLGSFLLLIAADSWLEGIGGFLFLTAAGLLFWFTVKALARIQMPTYPGSRD